MRIKVICAVMLIGLITLFQTGCEKQLSTDHSTSNESPGEKSDLKTKSKTEDSNNIYTMAFDCGNVEVKYLEGKLIIQNESGEVLHTVKGDKNDFYFERISDDVICNGYKMYKRIPDPYGSMVYYVVENKGEACVLLGNHALYEHGSFNDAYDYCVDIDRDGKKEIISMVYYTADGGIRTGIYRRYKNKIQIGDLADLLTVNKKKLDLSGVNLKSEYDKKKNKAIITYRLKTGKTKTVTKKIVLDKINFQDATLDSIKQYFSVRDE